MIEIVEHDGGLYVGTKRDADVGELLKITRCTVGHQFEIGEVVRCIFREYKGAAEHLDGHDWWYINPLDYVVLTPLVGGALEHDGVVYDVQTRSLVPHRGDKVLIVSNEHRPRHNHNAGAIGEVVDYGGSGSPFVRVGSMCQWINPMDMVVLTPHRCTDPAVDSPPLLSSLAEITSAQWNSLVERVARLERSLCMSPSDEQPVALPEPMLTREAVIAQAKLDVEKLLNAVGTQIPSSSPRRRHSYWPYSPSDEIVPTYTPLDRIEFHVNLAKRTVVALLSDYAGVWAKGVAKASPDDCFNAHIGKAIALFRLFGQDVPTMYTNAPQPVDPQVGDTVEITGNGRDNEGGIHCYSDGLVAQIQRKASVCETGWVVLPLSNRRTYSRQTISRKYFRIVNDTNE